MISSPIRRYPAFVVPTPTFSKVPKFELLATRISAVESELYGEVSFVGMISLETFDIVTLLFSWCIPWFL